MGEERLRVKGSVLTPAIPRRRTRRSRREEKNTKRKKVDKGKTIYKEKFSSISFFFIFFVRFVFFVSPSQARSVRNRSTSARIASLSEG